MKSYNTLAGCFTINITIWMLIRRRLMVLHVDWCVPGELLIGPFSLSTHWQLSQCDLFCSYGYRCSAHPLILSVIPLPWGRKRKSDVVATLNNAEPVMESSYRIELLFHSTLGCFFTLLCCSEILLSASASFCLNHISHESQLKRLKYHQITMKNENKRVWK